MRNLEKEEQPRRGTCRIWFIDGPADCLFDSIYILMMHFIIDTRATNGKKHKKEIVDSDGEDSSSSDDLPLSRRKDSSSTKRKAEVLSKLFPQESGKIGVTITTSPPNGSKPPKQITTAANKNSTTPSLTEVSLNLNIVDLIVKLTTRIYKILNFGISKNWVIERKKTKSLN